MNAEQICNALDGRRTGPDKYMARCVAHDEKTPSLSIRQAGDKTLVYCFGGCHQEEVIDGLRSRGLWPEAPDKPAIESEFDEVEARAFCAAYAQDWKRGCASSKAKRQYRAFQAVLCSPYTPDDVYEMHLYCLIYQSAVRGGVHPTDDESETFMRYQAVVLEKGVPCGY